MNNEQIDSKLDPVPGWTCAQEAFPVVLSLMAKIFWVNQQGALEKQLDPGRYTGIPEAEVLLRDKGLQTVAIYPS